MKPAAKILFLILIITATQKIGAQEKWVPIYDSEGKGFFVDVDGLNVYKGDDFYVWTLESNEPNLIIESVKGSIAETKTYYHINRKIKRYSILEIIYYDEDKNVLANFDYRNQPTYKNDVYSYPILEGGPMDAVLNICEKYLGKK